MISRGPGDYVSSDSGCRRGVCGGTSGDSFEAISNRSRTCSCRSRRCCCSRSPGGSGSCSTWAGSSAACSNGCGRSRDCSRTNCRNRSSERRRKSGRQRKSERHRWGRRKSGRRNRSPCCSHCCSSDCGGGGTSAGSSYCRNRKCSGRHSRRNSGRRSHRNCRNRSHRRRNRRRGGGTQTRSLGHTGKPDPPRSPRPSNGSSSEILLKPRHRETESETTNGVASTAGPAWHSANCGSRNKMFSDAQPPSWQAESRECYRRRGLPGFTARQGRVAFRQIAGPPGRSMPKRLEIPIWSRQFIASAQPFPSRRSR